MKICITSNGLELTSYVDTRFGRCQNFIVIDSETKKFEVIPNPGKDMQSGAGMVAAQIIIDSDIDVVISGNLGPGAIQVLKAAKIEMIITESDIVYDAFMIYCSSKIKIGV